MCRRKTRKADSITSILLFIVSYIFTKTTTIPILKESNQHLTWAGSLLRDLNNKSIKNIGYTLNLMVKLECFRLCNNIVLISYWNFRKSCIASVS